MASYFTRVELHDGDSDDYDKLHKEMADRKFFRAIKGHDGSTIRRLPTATYHCFRENSSSARVRDQAVEAANATGCSSIVLTAGVASWAGNFG